MDFKEKFFLNNVMFYQILTLFKFLKISYVPFKFIEAIGVSYFYEN